jgi:hypothetical protein
MLCLFIKVDFFVVVENTGTIGETNNISAVKDLKITNYMTKSMWTPARRTSHSKIMGINITASTLLGRLPTRC